ncbi:serine hydrolase domain-containing protein [Cytophagaceae bacterium YF14B1]|uniref:Serine hydrolase domain-containing protein n=1 Tax=Xanthocytophaga flava TaxID=3048013 RepID=A0AAE3U6F2_9BACT|nr:serine hydrolase domain-containing protein [Xanthocytophaga flavus]MDJ1481784.1 serine hydrolase domain-containing protein [Xanthocytophaga flavus]
MHLKFILFLLFSFFFLCKVFPQTGNLSIHLAVKDSIVAQFNRSDFKAIYSFADTAFSNHITEDQLTGFLRGLKNNGNILNSMLVADSANGRKYFHTEFSIRDMLMVLKVNTRQKFTTFGFYHQPPTLLTTTPQVNSNNPGKTFLDKSIDSIAREYFRNPKATALSIGVFKNGKQYTYHYGETKKGIGTLPKEETQYEIGSITKTFTATILAHAVIENKLALNDDIRNYLKASFPNLEYEGVPVRLCDLANHTARFPSLPGNFEKQIQYNPLEPYRNYTEEMLWQALHEIRLDTLPGYKFEYSNMGFAVLGKILENVYQMPYAELVKKYCAIPLKMKSLTTTLLVTQKKIAAHPYSENGNAVSFSSLGVFIPAGGIYASVKDMLHYIEVQINETNPAIALTHQITQNGVGLSWGIVSFPDGYRMLQHNGSTEGFQSNITIYPELKTGFVILVNTKSNIDSLIIGLNKILTPKKEG